MKNHDIPTPGQSRSRSRCWCICGVYLLHNYRTIPALMKHTTSDKNKCIAVTVCVCVCVCVCLYRQTGTADSMPALTLGMRVAVAEIKVNKK